MPILPGSSYRPHESRLSDLAINAASVARAALGLDCPGVIKMDPPIGMRGGPTPRGRATGRIEGLERLCTVLERHRGEYDAVADSLRDLLAEGLHQLLEGRSVAMLGCFAGRVCLVDFPKILFDVLHQLDLSTSISSQ